MDADVESQIGKDGMDDNNNLLSCIAFNAAAASLMIVGFWAGRDPMVIKHVATILNVVELNG